MPERNKIQAMLPRGCEMIENTAGTAPGIYCNYQSGDQKTLCPIFIMPGVPKEMKVMFERDVRRRLVSAAGEAGNVILSKTLHTFGLGESVVAERLGERMMRNRNPSVGTTVSNGYVSVRINAYFATASEASARLAEVEAACRDALGDVVWGQENDTLQEVVGKLLKASGERVTTAESCTGGLLSAYITDVPGSSAYFSQGFVTYSNEAKTALLDVPRALLEEHGAVSEPVVAAMAEGARRRAGADYALAISGIAGPDGGTLEKPVGTVCLALASGGGDVQTRRFIFHGDREMIRDRSAKMALTMLRFRLMGKKLPF
jgi:nicotinamide-nucleotide amidase